MKFSVVDFEKLTKKVGVVKESSVKDEGARALLDAAKSSVRETKSNILLLLSIVCMNNDVYV